MAGGDKDVTEMAAPFVLDAVSSLSLSSCHGKILSKAGVGWYKSSTLVYFVTLRRYESLDVRSMVLKGENFFYPTGLSTLSRTDLYTLYRCVFSRGFILLLL